MKIAIIGLGLRAAQLFMALKTINPEATLDVYVDPSPNGIKTLASYGYVPKHSTSIDQFLVKNYTPDLIIIASPPCYHFEHISHCMSFSCPIFIEKPVVATEPEFWKLLELLKVYPRANLWVGLPLNFSDHFKKLKSLNINGEVGDITNIQYTKKLCPERSGFYLRNWRRLHELSRGYLLEKCYHDLHIICSFLTSNPIRVYSFGTKRVFTKEYVSSLTDKVSMEMYHKYKPYKKKRLEIYT